MKHTIFTEKELESVFSGKRSKNEKAKIFGFLKTFCVFVLITAAIFILFNYQQLYKNLSYWYETNYQKADDKKSAVNSAQEILNKLAQEEKKNVKAVPSLPNISDNHLTIPSIKVDAPISWNVVNTPEATLDSLKNGLIHIAGTSLPGQKGNVFISGHSSNYPWVRSDYNNIFALLDKVVVGDVVHLKYLNKDYVYKVSEIKTVKPDDSSVMQSNNNSILSLMTCTPVGTNLKRLIVVANQIYPNPSHNTTTNIQNNQKMPKKVR